MYEFPYPSSPSLMCTIFTSDEEGAIKGRAHKAIVDPDEDGGIVLVGNAMFQAKGEGKEEAREGERGEIEGMVGEEVVGNCDSALRERVDLLLRRW